MSEADLAPCATDWRCVNAVPSDELARAGLALAARAGRHRADITPMIARHLSCAAMAPAYR
jgi:hypothetical protein